MVYKLANTLVIVEGGRAEVALMNRLQDIYGLGNKFEITSYGTHIYALYNSMFKDKELHSLDIQVHLRQMERAKKDSDKDKIALLSRHYAEVFLIFDLDPQDSQYSPGKIREMLTFFNESTDQGKLYINYPMVESFYHMKSIPDKDYNSYSVYMDELRPKNKYKQRVNKECRDGDPGKFAASKHECSIVIKQNIDKARFITGQADESSIPGAADILEAQLQKISSEHSIAVLCTCIFYIAEYNPILIEQ